MYSCVGIGGNSAFSNDYAIRDDSRREKDFCGSDLKKPDVLLRSGILICITWVIRILSLVY